MADKQTGLFKFLSTNWIGSGENRKKKLDAAEDAANSPQPKPSEDSTTSEYETTPEGMRKRKKPE